MTQATPRTAESSSATTAQALRAILQQHDRAEKHIGYHVLPQALEAAAVAAGGERNRYVFHEPARMAFFQQHVPFAGASVLDIGCNIGWFLFGALQAGAARATGFEGKASCAEFALPAIRALGLQDRFAFHPRYYGFDAEGDETPRHDIGLLLNVLHHLGDDYGDAKLDIAAARAGMLRQLNAMATRVDTLIFQLGFNWKGNRQRCLFEHGTKAEMIDFVLRGTAGRWKVQAIGVAERDASGTVRYAPLSATNIGRDDALGEFLNRPIFVLRSAQVPTH